MLFVKQRITKLGMQVRRLWFAQGLDRVRTGLNGENSRIFRNFKGLSHVFQGLKNCIQMRIFLTVFKFSLNLLDFTYTVESQFNEVVTMLKLLR